jgi:hypothetical protein
MAGTGIVLPSDLGFAAWSEPPGQVVISGAFPVAAGNLTLRRFSMPGPSIITTAAIIVNTVGVTLTAAQCFAGVWDGNGVLIGLSADQSVNWTGLGLGNMALTPGPSGPGVDTPYIYVGLWFNGTTPPFITRAATADVALINGLASVPASQARAVTMAGAFTTAATVPNQLSGLAKNVSLNAPFWCAVS